MLNLKLLGISIVGSGFIFSLIKSVSEFWTGYHALDTAFNFNNLGYSHDILTNGAMIKLSEAYTLGLESIKNGFTFMGFCIIFAFLFGLLICWGNKK